jgi:glycerol-3-phosphate dehydrogenase
VVLNATGPWSDATRRLDDGVAHAAVVGSKGVHVAVPRDRVPCQEALTLLHPDDGRVFFILPSPVHTIVGTTETPAESGPQDARANERDVEYLLRGANCFFPAAHLRDTDIISAWAGIRPLVAHAGASANDASREHHIETAASGLISITGGKLTTYRAMAAEIVDVVEGAIGASGSLTPSMTALVTLPGAGELSVDIEVRAAQAAVGVSTTADHLVRAYGDRWRMVWGLAERDGTLSVRLDPELPYISAEVVWAAAAEGAWTVADVLVRRMPIAYERRDAGRGLALTVAALMGRVHRWDVDAVMAAARAYDAESRRLFGVDP